MDVEDHSVARVDLPIIEYPRFWTKTSLIQLGYGVWAGMVIIGAGMAFGFSAVTLPALKGDETIETPTEYEKAWIGNYYFHY